MPSGFAIAVGELGEHCEHTVIGILIIENVQGSKGYNRSATFGTCSHEEEDIHCTDHTTRL